MIRLIFFFCLCAYSALGQTTITPFIGVDTDKLVQRERDPTDYSSGPVFFFWQEPYRKPTLFIGARVEHRLTEKVNLLLRLDAQRKRVDLYSAASLRVYSPYDGAAYYQMRVAPVVAYKLSSKFSLFLGPEVLLAFQSTPRNLGAEKVSPSTKQTSDWEKQFRNFSLLSGVVCTIKRFEFSFSYHQGIHSRNEDVPENIFKPQRVSAFSLDVGYRLHLKRK